VDDAEASSVKLVGTDELVEGTVLVVAGTVGAVVVPGTVGAVVVAGTVGAVVVPGTVGAVVVPGTAVGVVVAGVDGGVWPWGTVCAVVAGTSMGLGVVESVPVCGALVEGPLLPGLLALLELPVLSVLSVLPLTVGVLMTVLDEVVSALLTVVGRVTTASLPPPFAGTRRELDGGW